MSVEISNETLLSLAEAGKVLPGHPHVSTIARWAARGVGGVKLQTIKVGGRRFVSRQAIDEFIAATTAAADEQPATVITAKSRERAIQRAERELDKAGIVNAKKEQHNAQQ